MNAARDLGQGWKVSPSIHILPRQTVTLADIEGPGAIQHIWNTVHPTWWRRLILRVYWDGEDTPSIETPIGDFFCNGWCERCNISSLPIAVNPAGGFNSYWEMPFRKSARITLENLTEEECKGYYYQITYALTDVPDDAAYLHAQFRRSNPLPYNEVHTLLEGVTGQGHYVGTYLAWQVNNSGWWGEGRNQILSGWRWRVPDHCGDRHGGLFRRRVELRASTGAVRRVLDRLFGNAAGDHGGRGRHVPESSSGTACTAGTFPTLSASSRT